MIFITIFIVAVFVNNVVLSQFLGICPFLGVSKKVSTATGMGAAVTFVLLLATMVTWLVQTYILVPLGLGFLQQSQRAKQQRGTRLCIPSPPLYYARINLALYHTCDFSYASLVPERHHPLGTWAAPDARKSQGGQAREERNLPP